MVAGMLYSVWSELPHQGKPCSIIHRLEATQFSQNHVLLHHLSGIYLLHAAVMPPSHYIRAILI